MCDFNLLTVLISLEGKPDIFDCSAMEYEGAVWLVPRWLNTPDDGYAMPERLIQLDQFAHQKLEQTGDPADFILNIPLSRALFEGPITHQLKLLYVVLDRPNVRLRISGLLH